MQQNPLSAFPQAFQDYLVNNQIGGIRYIDDGNGGQSLYLPQGTDDLGSWYNDWQMPTVNGRKYFSSGGTDPSLQGADPKLLAALQAKPGSIITLPDGRVAIDNDVASQWGQQNAQGGLVQNFLNGPGPVIALGAGVGALGLGAALGSGASVADHAAQSIATQGIGTAPGIGGSIVPVSGVTEGGLTGVGTGLFDGVEGGFENIFRDPFDLGYDPSINMGQSLSPSAYGSNPLGGTSVLDQLKQLFNSAPPGTGTAAKAVGSQIFRDPFDLQEDPTINMGQTLDPSAYGSNPIGGSSFTDFLKSLTSPIPGGTGNQSLLGSLLGTAAGTIPSAMAFNWANNQKPDLSQLMESYNASKAPNPWSDKLLQAYNAAGANTPGLIQAAQRPLQQAQAMGYGDLLQSQAARGIRGSSFGDRDIGQYMNTTNTGIADAGLKAAQTSLGLQGQIANYGANAANQNLQLQGLLATRIPEAQSRNLAAMAPILGGSLSGIGNGLRSDSASNLGTWFSNLFSGY